MLSSASNPGPQSPSALPAATGTALSPAATTVPTASAMPAMTSEPYRAASSTFQSNQSLPSDYRASSSLPSGTLNGQFDIFEWHPAYLSCQKYFLDHAQHEPSVQAVAALINITLPFQWLSNSIPSFTGNAPQTTSPPPQFNAFSRQTLSPSPRRSPVSSWVSLIPFVRRLVITGFDRDPVLHGFFGDDWRKGIGPLQECERRNYLFAAKSGGWGKVKAQYDMNPQETVPFLLPPQNVQVVEIEAAEKQWSMWLAFEDWMVGEREPDHMEDHTRTDTN